MFSLNSLMFGGHGIANISGISLSHRAAILAKVARQLIEQGHHFNIGDDALSDQEIGQAIDKAKAEIMRRLRFPGVLGMTITPQRQAEPIDAAPLCQRDNCPMKAGYSSLT